MSTGGVLIETVAILGFVAVVVVLVYLFLRENL